MSTGLYFFKSGKKSGHPVNIYKDQLYIEIKRENAVTLAMNILKNYEDNPKEEILQIGLAGELQDESL